MTKPFNYGHFLLFYFYYTKIIKQKWAHIEHKNPSLTEGEVTLKCQHCRFQACIDAGMKEEYVQGSMAFGDNRTSRKTRTSSDGSPSSPTAQSAVISVVENNAANCYGCYIYAAYKLYYYITKICDLPAYSFIL